MRLESVQSATFSYGVFLQALLLGQYGGNGQSVTRPPLATRSSDTATATMLNQLLLAMAIP